MLDSAREVYNGVAGVYPGMNDNERRAFAKAHAGQLMGFIGRRTDSKLREAILSLNKAVMQSTSLGDIRAKSIEVQRILNDKWFV